MSITKKIIKILFLLISVTILYSCNLTDLPNLFSNEDGSSFDDTGEPSSSGIVGKWRITDTDSNYYIYEYKTDGTFEHGKDPNGIYIPVIKGTYDLSGDILTITQVSYYDAGQWKYYNFECIVKNKILISTNRMTVVQDINNDGIYGNGTDPSFAYNRI